MERIIRKVSPSKPVLPKKKHVAAYARVSSGKEAMLHSLSAQVSYYSDYIQKHQDWQYIGVYADEALTGTKDDRDEFQRLLTDCRSGLIDMVITKSISRFARNTVTMLEVVRELKLINVDVFFEKENIHSISGDGELMLTILASFAQEESHSVSENCKWRIRKKFEVGDLTGTSMYGYEMVDNTLKIYPEEAEVVRMIFQDYLNGMGRPAIVKKLMGLGIPTKRNCHWHESTIREILTNEKNAGEMLLQKTYVSNHLDKNWKFNMGNLPKYYVKNSHEGIIDKETFESVQQEIQRRARKHQPSKETPKKYLFTSKIICEQCGKVYRRKCNSTSSQYANIVWICSTFNKWGKKACSSQQIPEDILLKLTAEIVGTKQITESEFNKLIKEIRIPGPHKVIYILHNGQRLEKSWQHKSRRESWNEEKRRKARMKRIGVLERSKQS